MSKLPKIQPSELITKYELHPEIMDIFVEGDFDKDFICNYVNSNGKIIDATILPIDFIKITSDSGNSNKEAVITLATLVARELESSDINSVFIVDADFDRLKNEVRSCKYLIYTDFTCMEMYFYNTVTLRKFLTLTCNLGEKDREDFVHIAEIILPCLFTARIVNDILSLNVAIPGFSSGLKSKADLSTFNQEKYLLSFLSLVESSNIRCKAKQEFVQRNSTLPSDLRHKAHGHDFVFLLFEFLWVRKSLRLVNKGDDVIRFGGRILGTALNISELEECELFKRLATKLL